MDEDPLMLQPTWTVTTIVIELPGLFGNGWHLLFMVPLNYGRSLQVRRAMSFLLYFLSWKYFGSYAAAPYCLFRACTVLLRILPSMNPLACTF